MKNFLVLALLAGCAACGVPLDCKPRTLTLIGDLSKDLLGSWDGWGVDSRVVGTFAADGGFTTVEERNQYAPTGGVGTQAYSVFSDGGVSLGSVVYAARFTGDALVLQEDGGTPRTHPAVSCQGKGF